MTCQDCAEVCANDATVRVVEAGSEWFYCDNHAPTRDPGVVCYPVTGRRPVSRRITIEEFCEHDESGSHLTSVCWDRDERHAEQPDCRCVGGSSTVLIEPTPEMIERAAEALWERASIATTFDSGEALIAARAALTAALFGEEE